jgi:simple sugar transport system substrate-binding protein
MGWGKYHTDSKLSLTWPAALVMIGLMPAAESLGLGFRATTETDQLRLVFVTCAVDATFFKPVKKGAQDAARMLGVEMEFTGTPGIDVEAQAELVRQAIRSGVDGIALNIIDPAAFDGVVEEAKAAGIPVVAFNVDDTTPNARLAAVAQRLYEAGRTLGTHLAPQIPERSHILLTLHDRGVSALTDRARGLRDALESRDLRWTEVVTGNESNEAARVIGRVLREHGDIRVILGTGQSDTEAAGLAIKGGFSEPGTWSAGFDLSPATLALIQEGIIRCTIDQQPYLQGFYPVVQLTHYLRFGLLPPSIDAGATVIDRSNAEQVLKLTAAGYR